MSIQLYQAQKIETLFSEMIGQILQERKEKGLFYTPSIIIPNPSYKNWLQAKIARKYSIAYNFRYMGLEESFFYLYKQLGQETELVEELPLQVSQIKVLLVAALTIHLEKQPVTEELQVFWQYLYLNGKKRQDYSIRLWQLATRIARYFREYEYHSTQSRKLIYLWIRENWQSVGSEREWENAQAYLYRVVFAKGKILSQFNQFLYKQKYQEHKSLYILAKKYAKRLSEKQEPQEKETIYIFAMQNYSSFHFQVLRNLAKFYQFKVYLRSFAAESEQEKGNFFYQCAKAKRNSLLLIGEQRLFWLKEKIQGNHLLARLQRWDNQKNLGRQDSSIQVFSAPGIYREVETVYHSILYNLEQNPKLQLQQISIYTSDIKAYKAAIKGVFARGKEKLPYTIQDANVKSESIYSKAILSLHLLVGDLFW
ncbi:MAG: exodeoxyribonuclease V subunit gamma [Spirochaetota bacterium]